MGEVYLAVDPHIERQLAIKTVRLAGGRPQEIEDRKRRLLREARAAGRLLHPNVVTLFDTGEAEGLLYLAFEFVEGADLAGRLERDDAPSLREVLHIVHQVAEALDYAHRQGIVHRDIKPSNILIDTSGRVKVADFGIAKVAGQNTELTVVGSVMGSPQYLSPEQIRGEELDGRSDVFSLGVVLYEMLSGQRPFAGETITTLVYQILHKDPSISALRVVPLRLEQLLHDMMAKDREDRLSTAGRVAEEVAAIERELPEEVLAAPAAAVTQQLDATRVLPPRSGDVAPAAAQPRSPATLTAAAPPAPPIISAAARPPAVAGRSSSTRLLLALAAVLILLLGGGAFSVYWLWQHYVRPGVTGESGGSATAAASAASAASGAGTQSAPSREPLVATTVAKHGAPAGASPPAGAAPSPAGAATESRTPAKLATPPATGGGRAPHSAGAGAGGVSGVAAPPPVPTTRSSSGSAQGARDDASGQRAKAAPTGGLPARGTNGALPAHGETDASSGQPEAHRTAERAVPAPHPTEAAAGTEREEAPGGGTPSSPAADSDLVLKTGLELAFRVNPPDALVLLDGAVIGRAEEWSGQKGSRSFTLPNPGPHLVKVRKGGMRDYKITVEAAAVRGTTPVVVTLRPLPTSQVMTTDLETIRVREAVAFSVKPDSAMIYVDGSLVGQAKQYAGRFGRANEWLSLSPGIHRVALIAPGYRRREYAVEVTTGADKAKQRIDAAMTAGAAGD